jgi:hypothetical protein
LLTGSRCGGFPSGTPLNSDRPGFPITGRRRAGVAAAADNGSDKRGSFRDSENAATDARRGLPIRGEFTRGILPHQSSQGRLAVPYKSKQFDPPCWRVEQRFSAR